jgi:hypothetical protein
MAEVFTPEVRGENQLIAHMRAIPDELQDRLAPVLQRLSEELLRRVKAAEPERTGALKAATQAFTFRNANRMRGGVRIVPEPGQGSHNIKAAALEYGAHGAVNVKAHEQSLDHVYDTPIDPEEVLVSAYHRDANIAALRFERDSLSALYAEFLVEVELAINDLARTW